MSTGKKCTKSLEHKLHRDKGTDGWIRAGSVPRKPDQYASFPTRQTLHHHISLIRSSVPD